MESINSHEKYIRKKILKQEIQNDDFENCFSEYKRNILIIDFLSLLKPFLILRRVKERTILIFDQFMKVQNVGLKYQRYVLMSLLKVSIKLEQGYTLAKTTMKNIMDTLIENANSSQEKKEVSFSYIDESIINSTEIFVLNSLGWRLELTIFSEFTDFFINNHLSDIFKFIKKDNFMLLVDFFTECCLSAFNTSYIPMHTIAIVVIILSLDQFTQLFSSKDIEYKNQFKDLIISFLEILKINYNVDMMRLNNYKKISLEYLENNNIKAAKNYPDNNIEYIINKKKNHSDLKLGAILENKFINKNYFSENLNKTFNVKKFKIDNEKENSNYSSENKRQFKYLNNKDFLEDSIGEIEKNNSLSSRPLKKFKSEKMLNFQFSKLKI